MKKQEKTNVMRIHYFQWWENRISGRSFIGKLEKGNSV